MVIRISFITVLLFLILCAVAAFIYWYAFYFSNTTYQIVIQNSVSGLTENTPVEFNGVQVGTVDHIDFDRKHPEMLKIFIKIDEDTPITQGTLASVAISEIVTHKYTGFPYIYITLSDQGKDLRPLTKKSGEKFPEITALPTDPQKTLTSLERMSSSLQQTQVLFQSLLSNENIEAIKQLVYSLQQVAGVMAANSEKLNTIIANVEKSSRYFEPFLQNGRDTMIMLNTQTLPQLYQFVGNLDNSLQKMQQFVNKLENNPSVIIRGEKPPVLGPGEKRLTGR